MADVLTVEAAKEAKLSLIEDGRGSQAVHDLVVALRANRRSGSACAKTRGEVKASGKKPYRQKGTGRARQGGNAAPLHRGGGVVFGPRPRSYAKTVNKQVRRLAFAAVLSAKIEAGEVSVIPEFQVESGKTKSFAALVRGITDRPKVLVIGAFDEFTRRAGRNVRAVLLMSPEQLNVEQLLHYDQILITKDSLEALAKRTAGIQSKKEKS